MVTRIRQGTKPRLYLREHREEKGLSLETVAGRVGVERNTIWRWENDQKRLNPGKIADYAAALELEPEDLWRRPARPSLDAMVKDVPDDLYNTAADIVRRLTKRAS